MPLVCVLVQLIEVKVSSALKYGLNIIPCVDEKIEERQANRTKDFVIRQLTAIAGIFPSSASTSTLICSVLIYILVFNPHICCM